MSLTSATSIKQPRGAIDAMLGTACIIAVAGTAWWALAAPMRELPAVTSQAVAAGPSDGDKDGGPITDANGPPAGALDLAAFRAPLWVVPPAPPVAAKPAPEPPPPPPPPPLKWQLLAIVSSGGSDADTDSTPRAALRALLYDPESDTLLELTAGQEHAGKSVERITANTVVIRHGKATHTLSLDPRERAAAAAGGTP